MDRRQNTVSFAADGMGQIPVIPRIANETAAEIVGDLR
jgi:hypothetical protein